MVIMGSKLSCISSAEKGVFKSKKSKEFEKILCDKCTFTCQSINTMDTHKNFKHLSQNRVKCDQCDFTCDHSNQLGKH